jgi:hypothetical protein
MRLQNFLGRTVFIKSCNYQSRRRSCNHLAQVVEQGIQAFNKHSTHDKNNVLFTNMYNEPS